MFSNISISNKIRLAVLGGIVLTAACQGSGGACAADPVAGLNISVLDIQGNSGTIGNVKIVARDGAWGDSVSSSTRNITSWVTAFDRPGTYVVTVTGDGVKPFTVSGVVVSQNGCHVRPVDVVATMTPQ